MTKKKLIIIYLVLLFPGCSNLLSDKNSALSFYESITSKGTQQNSISINNGAIYSYNLSGYLVLNAANGSEMCFSNDNLSWSAWEPFKNITNWNLSEENGIKTVYSKIRKNSGEIITLSDSIVYLNKIIPSNNTQDFLFGHSISLSSDGFKLLVGSNNQSSGSAFIYKWNVANWDEIELQRAITSQDDYFGSAVSLSGNGTIAAVGAYGFSSQKGAVYIFRQNNIFADQWDEENIITATDASTTDYFGYSAAFSKDGSTLVVGAPGKDSGAILNTGKVYVFLKVNDSWIESFQFTANDAHSENIFGSSVAVSFDGSVIAVSAPYASQNSGAVYIFRKNNSSYIQNKIIETAGSENNFFGSSISLTDNGNILASSSPGHKVGSNLNQGVVCIFEYDGLTWNQTRTLSSSDGKANDGFGNSVSISSNGEFIAVGSSRYDEFSENDAGAVYIYKEETGIYSEYKKHTAQDGLQNFLLGSSVSISSDGTRISAGSKGDSTVTTRKGSVYVFSN